MNKTKLYKLLPRLYRLLSNNSIYNYRFKSLGENSYLNKEHKINNSQYISIGDSVTIEKDAWLNVIKVNEAEHGHIIVDNNANLGMRCTLSSTNKIILGKNVLIGLNVYIADHEHKYDDPNMPIMYQGTKGKGVVNILDNAWIGNNVVILAKKNLNIGKNSIIGANSVVKDSVPDFSIAVGNPAKVVKKYNLKSQRWERVR